MWTWERERRRQAQEPDVQLGAVTLSGEETAANLGGERRWMQVCAPGGYAWRPRQGERALILKTGQDTWVLGVTQGAQQVKPGEVKLTGSGSSVLLGERVEIKGEVYLDHQSLEDYVREIVAEMLAGG